MLPKSHLRRNRNQFQVSDQGRDIAADNAIESTDSSRGRSIFFASILAMSGVILVATSSGDLSSNGNVRYLRQLAAGDSKDVESVISPEISSLVHNLAAPFLADEANIFAFNKTDTRPVMNTFFAIPKGKTIQKTDAETLAIWKAAWSAAGWNPRILNTHHAEAHPDFANISKKLKEVPLGINPDYDRSCYLRHFAMTLVGGGWMSDYDTVPLNMNAEDFGKDLPNNGRFTTYQRHVPSLIVGNNEEWDRVSQALLHEGVVAKNNANLGVSIEGRQLFSDMYALEVLVNNGKVSANTTPEVGARASEMLVRKLLTWDSQNDSSLQERCKEKQFKAVHFSHLVTEEIGFHIDHRPLLIASFLDRWSRLCGSPEDYFSSSITVRANDARNATSMLAHSN